MVSETAVAWLTLVGSLIFGIVIGWVTYRTLRWTKPSGLTDIATVIGAVGGAAVTALFPKETGAFGAYCIGLGIGFFAYLATAGTWKSAPVWLGSDPSTGPNASGPAATDQRRRPDAG